MKNNRLALIFMFLVGGCSTTLNTNSYYYYENNGVFSKEHRRPEPTIDIPEVHENKPNAQVKYKTLYLCKSNTHLDIELKPISKLIETNYPNPTEAIRTLGNVVRELRADILKHNLTSKSVACKNYKVIE